MVGIPHLGCGRRILYTGATYKMQKTAYNMRRFILVVTCGNIGKIAYRMREYRQTASRMRECRPEPHIRCGFRLSPHTVCEIPHTPDLLSDPHILVFGEPHIVCGFGLHAAYSMQYPAHLPRNSPAYSMRYPHTVCGTAYGMR